MKPTGKPDPYTQKAHKAGYPARSIYKLEEIDRRVSLVRAGQRVLDLGAAPGSWTQYLAGKVGPKGTVVALDLNPLKVALGPTVIAREMDVLACALEDIAALGPFDLVLSDMAPHTSGLRDADVARSVELVERAMAIADVSLRPGGGFVAKVFQGSGFEELRAALRKRYTNVRLLKPDASRKESSEIYMVGLGRRAEAAL